MNGVYYVFMLFLHFCNVQSNRQNPEINDQFEVTTKNDYNTTAKHLLQTNQNTEQNKTEQETINTPETDNWTQPTLGEIEKKKQHPLINVFKLISLPIHKIVEIPKINSVLRNVGTCLVNGVMDILTYYLPSPFIPLIASTAGMMIPFEPIITLRRRMPVTSYRRAFQSAVNGFLNTFDRYKFDNYDNDPYMTRRFNRRFMNDDSKETNKV